MKPVFVLLLAAAFAACNGNKTAKQQQQSDDLDKVQQDSAHYTTVTWLDSLVNFGTITMGEQRNVKFRFKNTGTYPLIITNVAAGCGCTVASYTKEPVAPGEEGWVTGAFDSNKSHPGAVRKNIMVRANTTPKQEFELVFTGEIKDAK
jgi:hypothetical protein